MVNKRNQSNNSKTLFLIHIKNKITTKVYQLKEEIYGLISKDFYGWDSVKRKFQRDPFVLG